MKQDKTLPLKDIFAEKAPWVQHQFVAEFLKGHISGFNPQTGYCAGSMYTHKEQSQSFTYIEAYLHKPILRREATPMPEPIKIGEHKQARQNYAAAQAVRLNKNVPLKGAILLDDPPKDYDQYGKCKIDFGIGVEYPIFSFELEHRKTKAIKSIEIGESIVLTYPYKKIGYITKHDVARVYITNDSYIGPIVSMECENRYFRGLNKTLLQAAKNFAAQNRLDISYEKNHLLYEELVFAYLLHANKSFSGYLIPDEHSITQHGVKNYLYNFFLNLHFIEKEAVDFLDKLECNDRPKPTYTNHEDNYFIIEKGQCRIKYNRQEFIVKNYSGMDYIQTLLCSDNSLTYLEIMKATREVDQVAIESEQDLSSFTGEKISLKPYFEKIEKLEEDYSCAKENGDLQDMESIQEKIDNLCDIIRKNKYPVEARNTQLKKVRDSVAAAIKRSKNKIKIVNPELGAHLDESITSTDIHGSRVARLAYRPKEPVRWNKN